MIRKRIFISILVIVSIFVFSSQVKAEKSFLWKIQTEKGNSYLLGSIHLLKKEYYPLRKVIEDSFAECDALVVEADLNGDKAMKSGVTMLQKGFYKEGESLKTDLSEKTYQLAADKLKSIGMNIENFQKYKPWMLAMLVLNQALVKLGFNPSYGIDFYFLGKATAMKKEILELEGIEFQLKLFESFSKAEMEKFLLSTLLESDQMGTQMDLLIKSWLSGDLETMETLMTDGVKKEPELSDFYNKLIDVRNAGMMEKIQTYLKEGKKIFVVVGAAHMVGKKGIVQLLKDKGFKVDQL
jgi:uncharacterized protein